MTMRGTPAEVGFERSPKHDHLLTDGREVWRTPEGVLLALPPGCSHVDQHPLQSPRGTTLAVLEPPGTYSIHPFKRRESDHGPDL